MKTIIRLCLSIIALTLLMTACGQKTPAPQNIKENNEEEKIAQLVIDFINQNGKDNIHVTKLYKVHPKIKLYADFSETEDGLAILKQIRLLMDSIKNDVDIFKTTGLKMRVMNLGDEYREAESEYKPTEVKGWRVRCNLDAMTEIVFHFNKELSTIIGYESNQYTKIFFPDSVTSQYSMQEKIDKLYYQ